MLSLRWMGISAFVPFQYCEQRLVAAVNILAEFQLTLIINESGLIGEVNRDEGRKLDVGFANRGEGPALQNSPSSACDSNLPRRS